MAEYRVAWRPVKATGYDHVDFRPHAFRRANITMRQEVGGSAIEASKIAGHRSVEITEKYTFVDLGRQGETTRTFRCG